MTLTMICTEPNEDASLPKDLEPRTHILPGAAPSHTLGRRREVSYTYMP